MKRSNDDSKELFFWRYIYEDISLADSEYLDSHNTVFDAKEKIKSIVLRMLNLSIPDDQFDYYLQRGLNTIIHDNETPIKYADTIYFIKGKNKLDIKFSWLRSRYS